MRRRWRKPVNIREKGITSFNTITDLAFMEERGSYSYIGLDKALNLSVKRVAWLKSGELVDDTLGVLESASENALITDRDTETENKSFALMHRLSLLTQSCPAMYWSVCGDYSHLVFSQECIGEYKHILRYLRREACTFQGQSPWKFAGIKFQGNVYVYPHHLFYLLEVGCYRLTDEFKFAIMFGEPLSSQDVVLLAPESHVDYEQLQSFLNKRESSRYDDFYNDYVIQSKASWQLPPLPKQYLNKTTEFISVNVEVPINMAGTSLDGAEYKLQEFYLPKDAEKSHAEAILARQSLDLLALAEMKHAFSRLKKACENSPSLALAVAGLVTDDEKIVEFRTEVEIRDHDMSDYRAKLVERSASLYPIQHDI